MRFYSACCRSYALNIHKNKGDSQGDNSEKKAPQNKRILNVRTLIEVVVVVEGGVVAVLELGVGYGSTQIGKIIAFMFGTESSILSYFAMFTVILVFSIPFILQRLRKESSKG